jgi:hypothetical protein
MSLRSWAKARGVPWATAQKAQGDGRLTAGADPDVWDREWAEGHHPPSTSSAIPSRADSERLRAHYDAELRRLALAEKAGDILPKSEVVAYRERALNAALAAWRQFPERLVRRVVELLQAPGKSAREREWAAQGLVRSEVEASIAELAKALDPEAVGGRKGRRS